MAPFGGAGNASVTTASSWSSERNKEMATRIVVVGVPKGPCHQPPQFYKSGRDHPTRARWRGKAKHTRSDCDCSNFVPHPFLLFHPPTASRLSGPVFYSYARLPTLYIELSHRETTERINVLLKQTLRRSTCFQNCLMQRIVFFARAHDGSERSSVLTCMRWRLGAALRP